MSLDQIDYYKPKAIGDYGNSWWSAPLANKVSAVQNESDNKYIYLSSGPALALEIYLGSAKSYTYVNLSSVYSFYSYYPPLDPIGNSWNWNNADLAQIGVKQGVTQSFKCYRVPDGISTVNGVGVAVKAKYSYPYTYVDLMRKEVSY